MKWDVMRRWREWDRSGRNIRNPPVSAPIFVHRRSLHSSFPALRFFHSSFRSLRDEDGRSGVTDDGRRMSPWVTEERQAARSLRSSRYASSSVSSPYRFAWGTSRVRNRTECEAVMTRRERSVTRRKGIISIIIFSYTNNPYIIL